MHPTVQSFVERMGLIMEAEGMSRIAGRIFGFLLVHEGAFSLDELVERLQVSKASVSTNARFLERIGIVERTSAPGDRRDFYRVGPDVWERVLRIAQRKWEAMRVMLAEAEAALPREMEVGRQRLSGAERFHALMIEQMERLLELWRERREGASVGAAGAPVGRD